MFVCLLVVRFSATPVGYCVTNVGGVVEGCQKFQHEWQELGY